MKRCSVPFLILIFMSVTVWGLLSKASDNAQTIEEAIQQAIADHNADEEAHLDEGQSLAQHITENVLDHLAGSVVADKLGANEDRLETTFESLDNWQTNGEVALEGWPGVSLYIETGAVEQSNLYSQILYAGGLWDFSRDMLLQFSGWFDFSEDFDCAVTFGLYTSPTDMEGFGFLIVDGVLKGAFSDGGAPTLTSAISVDLTVPHVYRAFYDSGTSVLSFYVDGVLEATLSVTPFEISADPELRAQLKTNGTIDGYFRMKKLMLAFGF